MLMLVNKESKQLVVNVKHSYCARLLSSLVQTCTAAVLPHSDSAVCCNDPLRGAGGGPQGRGVAPKSSSEQPSELISK